MGSNSRGKDGEGTSGVKKEEEEEDEEKERERERERESCYNMYEQDVIFQVPELLLHAGNNNSRLMDRLVQLHPHQHQHHHHHPPSPLGVPQVPVAAMQGPHHHHPHSILMLQDGYVESVIHERLKRVNITWNHPGTTDVSIIGSWDNWETREALQSIGQAFVIVKTLPIGIYHYRFIVNGYLTHSPEFPSAFDDSGYAYNILDLQDYIPETVPRLSDVEDPPSPPWSYDNILLNDDEFSRPPPELPPQLQVTMRDEPSTSTGDSGILPRPSHLELNHLYIHKAERDEFAALRSTHKFEHKYVTMLLYKSLRRQR